MAKNEIAVNMFWSFAEKVSAQLVTTIVGIVLARILDPADYGTISVVTVFITICNLFVTRGLGTAIVQKKEVSDYDYTTALILNVCMGIILYGILFGVAPIVEKIFDIKELTLIIRVLGIRIPLASVLTVQQSYIQRNMQFKKFFIATLMGTVISCVVGIVMAYQGYGVWALVFQYLINAIIDTIILSIVSGWRPKRGFSKDSARYIIKFGSKIIAVDLVCAIADNYRYLIIGKKFGSEDLAYMDQGKKYPHVIINNVTASIQQVMLAGFSKKQDNIEALKNLLRKSLDYGMFILSPLMVGLISVSDNLVKVVLTEKWMPIIPFITVYGLTYLMGIIGTISHQVILAIGRNDIVLKIQIFINTVDVLCVSAVLLFKGNVFAVACTILIANICGVLSFSSATWKQLDYSAKEQATDILPSVLISCFMGIVVFVFGRIPISKTVVLILQIIIGGVTYLFVAGIFNLKGFVLLKENVRRFIK